MRRKTMTYLARLFVLSVASTIAWGSTAFAGTILEVAMGNTVSITEEGLETRFYYNENGSVSQANANGESDTGTWEANGGTLCTVWTSAAEPICLPLSDQQAAVGDTVTVVGPDGASTELTILAGKVPF
tara:strand:- start:153 stop:539 length:387 start_codon:yes stop_codon:yes gene_type:complete